MEMEEEEFLEKIPIFRGLEKGELRQFLKIARRVRFPKGKAILIEGQPGETMYIIEEGIVEVSKTLVLGGENEVSREKDKVLTKLSAEDHAIFGEVALFEQSKRTATVVALSDCQLLEIAKADFLRLADENPRLGYRIARNIIELLCSRLRRADEDTIKLTTALSIALSR